MNGREGAANIGRPGKIRNASLERRKHTCYATRALPIGIHYKCDCERGDGALNMNIYILHRWNFYRTTTERPRPYCRTIRWACRAVWCVRRASCAPVRAIWPAPTEVRSTSAVYSSFVWKYAVILTKSIIDFCSS